MRLAEDTARVLLVIGIMVPLFLLWIVTFVDIARRKDLSLPRKAMWTAVTFFGVYIGIAVYAAMRPVPEVLGKGIRQTVPETSATVSTLETLRAEHAGGSIGDADYLAKKRDLLGLT
jgi:hypothetical protein